MAEPQLQSTLTCPYCGHQASETMPTNACQHFYDCKGCGEMLKPLPGDCCVFCSYGSVPCPPVQEARASGSAGCCGMRSDQSAKDWLGNARTSLLAWGLPQAAMLAGLFVAVPLRTPIWTLALAWMGMACMLNAHQCSRTHCRYTGPYYLATVIPVAIVGMGILPLGFYGWALLGIVILGGSYLIWWATERAWGKFSNA